MSDTPSLYHISRVTSERPRTSWKQHGRNNVRLESKFLTCITRNTSKFVGHHLERLTSPRVARPAKANSCDRIFVNTLHSIVSNFAYTIYESMQDMQEECKNTLEMIRYKFPTISPNDIYISRRIAALELIESRHVIQQGRDREGRESDRESRYLI